MRIRRRSSAFTLVELLIVVAILGIVAGLAARMYSRGVRGESAPKFARTMMATLLDARHQAMALGRPTQVTLKGSSTVISSAYDPVSATFVPQSTITLPSTLEQCVPTTSVTGNLGSTYTATCPLPATTTNNVCFWPNGRASVDTSGSDCKTTSPTLGTGGTLFLQTYAADKKYRIWVWGLTGMIKMTDQ